MTLALHAAPHAAPQPRRAGPTHLRPPVDAAPPGFARGRRWNLALGGFCLLVAVFSAWTVRSEVQQYGRALVVLVGLALLRPAFAGSARQWWGLALGLQLWHYCEQFLIVMQVGTGWRLAGEQMPISVLQLLVPRVEVQVFYNVLVTIPMVVAVILRALDCRGRASTTQGP
jgi:hypothetical membrane protein